MIWILLIHENEFIIIIGCHLDTLDPITVQMDGFVKINYTMNAIDQLEWCWMMCSIVICFVRTHGWRQKDVLNMPSVKN